MKKPLLWLTILLTLAMALPALAADKPTRAGIRDEAYAYIRADQAYFVTGRPVTFTVVLPEQPQGYIYEYTLYYTPDRVTQNLYEGIAQKKESFETTFSHTPANEGQYFLEITIYDADYKSVRLQTQPFYAFAETAEADPATLPGKVKAIASELNALNLPTQYDKALWLHDWLTANADYDEPMTIHTPEGVLLQGKGVCESYALAFSILLHEVDIEDIYVTGYSRGELHAWNLVNVDGEWTYIDPTWDDPVGGGKEGHDYFGLTSDLIARDHDSSSAKLVPPAATGLTHNWALRNGVKSLTDEEGLYALLTEGLQQKQAVIDYVYHGTNKYFYLNDLVERWMKNNFQRYFVTSYTYGGSSYSGRVEAEYGDFSAYRTFTTEEEFGVVMDELLNAKTPLLQAYYVGEDPYFDFGSLVRKWFGEHMADYPIASYEYTYYPSYGDISVTYK